jgi:ATP-dependent protease ClpP protease subunit
MSVTHHCEINVPPMPEIVSVNINDFSSESVYNLSQQIAAAHQQNQPVLPVYIYSYGGDAYGCMAMCDMLKHCPVPVATILYGTAMSSAALLFTCGRKNLRFMSPNGTMMLHDVKSTFETLAMKTLLNEVAESSRINEAYFDILDKNTEQPAGYFKNILDAQNANLYLTAEQCVRHKIASHIGVPQFHIHTRLERTFEVSL